MYSRVHLEALQLTSILFLFNCSRMLRSFIAMLVLYLQQAYRRKFLSNPAFSIPPSPNFKSRLSPCVA